jgi:hypothetical protein
MSTGARDHEETAVVRVTVHGTEAPSLRIELLAMGLRPQLDRPLGRTASPSEACDILHRWLDSLASTQPS